MKYFPQKTGFDISCNLHEMSNPVFCENKQNIANFSSAELAQRVAELKATIWVNFVLWDSTFQENQVVTPLHMHFFLYLP